MMIYANLQSVVVVTRTRTNLSHVDGGRCYGASVTIAIAFVVISAAALWFATVAMELISL